MKQPQRTFASRAFASVTWIAPWLAFTTPWVYAGNFPTDYEPDRVRVSAEAKMEAITGDGIFERAQNVYLKELKTDGQGITGYTLTVDDVVYNFSVNKTSGTTCGDIYEAQDEVGARLLIKDMSFAECQVRSKYFWEGQVFVNQGEKVSHLFIGGHPEHWMLTE